MSRVLAMKEVTKMKQRLVFMFAIVMAICAMPASAETEVMPEMDHSTMDHNTMDQSTMPGMDHSTMPGMDHGTVQAVDNSDSPDMSESTVQGGSAPADARDPHAYSDGYTFGAGPKLRLGDEHNFASLLFDRLESVRTSDTTATVYDLMAWYGRDYDRAVLKAEGHIEDGKAEESSLELVWSHAIMAYWDTQLGIRHDSGVGPDRNWLAFGVKGLAPYWFEVDATAYIGTEGRTAMGIEAEYEIPFTQQLILQPRIETMLYGKEDIENGIGKGLAEITLGMRLRYEFIREFGPYIGVEWKSLQGETASMARDAGLDTRETLYIAGVRMWF